MYVKLPTGEHALIIAEVPEDLVPYFSSEYPEGMYLQYELWLSLETGKMYAKKPDKF